MSERRSVIGSEPDVTRGRSSTPLAWDGHAFRAATASALVGLVLVVVGCVHVDTGEETPPAVNWLLDPEDVRMLTGTVLPDVTDDQIGGILGAIKDGENAEFLSSDAHLIPLVPGVPTEIAGGTCVGDTCTATLRGRVISQSLSDKNSVQRRSTTWLSQRIRIPASLLWRPTVSVHSARSRCASSAMAGG